MANAFVFNESTPPSNPPRKPSSRARRHAWSEPVVRPWLLSGLILILIACAFVSTAIARSSRGRRLVANGIKGEIEFQEINGEIVPGKKFEPQSGLKAKMNIHLPGRDKYTREGLVPQYRKTLEVKGKIPVYVDPDNNNIFVIQDEYPLSDDLIVGFLLAPPALLLFAVALWKRHRILHLWKTGQPAVGIVIEVVKSPIAPFSQVVRFALRDLNTNRIFPICIPNSFHAFKPNDLAFVLVNPNHPTLAILPDLYS